MKKILFTLVIFASYHAGFSQIPVQIKDINPGGAAAIPFYDNGMTEYNGKLYFSADDGTHGVELWATDGTEGGTTLVKDISSGTDGSMCQHFYPANGHLLFAANTGLGTELWRTDGTEAGTVLVRDIWPGGNSSIPLAGPTARTFTSGTAYCTSPPTTARPGKNCGEVTAQKPAPSW